MPVNSYQFFQVTTSGHTNRYLRHYEALGYTEVVDGNSTATLKQDATFQRVPGLADFESFNYPGRYIRHYASEVWTASGYGTDWDSGTGLATDSSWNSVSPWVA